jgi:UDP-N-acetylmuramate--alanine ligase
VFVLFQPHRYSRTQSVANEFGHCFDGAHRVFITDIYAAGEKPIPGISTHTIIDRVKAESKVAIEYAPSIDAMIERVAEEARAGDLVITMGAGDITRAGDKLLDRLGRVAEKKDAR